MTIRQLTDPGDQALLDWGGWVRSKLDGQGWGGAVDRDWATTAMRGPRDSGTHSDPLYAEMMATAADKQSEQQRIHRHLSGYTRDWKRVAWLRWVGRQEIDPRPGPARTVTQHGTVQVARRLSLQITVRQVVQEERVSWSCGMSWPDVATHSGIPLRSVEMIGSQVRRQVMQDLRADRAVSKGRAGVHGQERPDHWRKKYPKLYEPEAA